MTPTIVFDFDGTLALGDGPIVAFARAIGDRTGDAGFAARAEAALERFAVGDSDHRDGYDTVTRLALADGVSRDVLDGAYGASRALLGSDAAPVEPPDGLAGFVQRIEGRARLVLATNAPGDSVAAVLEAWGIAAAFDATHFSIGKPDGLVPVLRDALARGPVLAVGDIVEFDLAPAAALGADTALVGATAGRAGTAGTAGTAITMQGASLADLYDAIDAWIASASASPSSATGEQPRPSIDNEQHTHPEERQH